MYHPAFSDTANKALRQLLSHPDCRLNVLASRLEASIVCPDRIVYAPATTRQTDDILIFHYGKRSLHFSCVYHPIDGLVVDSHTVPPLTPREHSTKVELIVPIKALLLRPFIFK